MIAPAVGGGDLERRLEHCALCELHPGEADGLGWDEFESATATRAGSTTRSAVSLRAVRAGTDSSTGLPAAVEAIAERHPGGLVVVACHGGVIEATMLSFLAVRRAVTGRCGLPTAYTSLTEWELGRMRWTLMRYNDVAHLGGPYEPAQRSHGTGTRAPGLRGVSRRSRRRSRSWWRRPCTGRATSGLDAKA